MVAPRSYTTIAAAVVTETEISRSRFLCHLAPAGDEEAARGHIAAVRALHPRARHHCTAFVLGPEGQLQRTNDDGEPSGTAGAPMLEALTAGGLSDVAAVVVRYFGGVLLGTGGLARAYRGSVAGAVDQAQPVLREERAFVAVTLPYAEAASLEGEARRRGWSCEATYGAEVGLRLGTPPEDGEILAALVAGLSAGRATVKLLPHGWVTVAR